MNETGNSYRRILASTSTIGGATAVGVLFGLVRMKVAALVLGTVGVGLIGLLNNLIATGAALTGLGVSGSATRQLATQKAIRGGRGEALARRTLFLSTLMLATLATIAIFAFRTWISDGLLGNATGAADVGWVALGVGLTLVATSQTSLLTGLGRIGDVAKVTILCSIFGTTAAVAGLLLWGQQAVIPYVLAAPATAVIVGAIFTLRLPRPECRNFGRAEILRMVREFAALGIAMMLGGLVLNGGQLMVRSLVMEQLGLAQLGLFQAAWTISMTYLGFILQAMGTDFFPRLSAIHDDPEGLNRLVNEQTEVALLLGTPIILLLLGLAPWIIRLLYSADFIGAGAVLRWQLLGDCLKLASWPLGFVLLATARGKTFVLLEVVGVGVFVVTTGALLPGFGIAATGSAFLTMYLVYLTLVHSVAQRITGFRWTRRVQRDLVAMLLLATIVFLIATASEIVGALVGVLIAFLWAFLAWKRLLQVLASPQTQVAG